MLPVLDRRLFLKNAAALALAGLSGVGGGSAWAASTAAARLPKPSAAKLPAWRGFNLLEKFIARAENAPFRETDFAWMAEWGFNFVRLPMSYRCWSDPTRWRELREPVLEEIDQAVEFGRRYGIHVSLNFHRAPGYSVDRAEEEPFNLWTDGEALEACAYHWRHFAQRYRDIPSEALSFDLVNEPAMKSFATNELLDGETYLKVARVLVDEIRAERADRLIIADGLLWGRIPVPELATLGVAQSTRGYDPMPVSHWKADWVEGADSWPRPTWPLPVSETEAAEAREQFEALRRDLPSNPIMQQADAGVVERDWDRARIDLQLIQPWKRLEDLGVGVHVGECGAYNGTPHDVALAWLGDLVRAWKAAGWGWALWNLRGPFGIVDSGRRDVKYERFHGHDVDRRMLEIVRGNVPA